MTKPFIVMIMCCSTTEGLWGGGWGVYNYVQEAHSNSQRQGRMTWSCHGMALRWSSWSRAVLQGVRKCARVTAMMMWSLMSSDVGLLCCLTSTEAGWPIRDGDRVGKRARVIGSTAETARKRPERPWTAARTMEVLRRCPLAIAQRLVHCAIALSTAVLDRVTKTMSVAPLMTNNLDNSKQKMSGPNGPVYRSMYPPRQGLMTWAWRDKAVVDQWVSSDLA